MVCTIKASYDTRSRKWKVTAVSKSVTWGKLTGWNCAVSVGDDITNISSVRFSGKLDGYSFVGFVLN